MSVSLNSQAIGFPDYSVNLLPFSQTIKFNVSAEFPQYSVIGALPFTPDLTNAKSGVTVNVDLISNGVNVPTFTGFKEWGGSAGYNNSNGIRNCVTFFYRSGIAWFSIDQEFGAIADPVLPGSVTNFAAGAATGTSQVLTWGAPSTGTPPFTYTVGKRLHSAGGAYTAISTAATSPFTASSLTASTDYDYEIFATNIAGSGAHSNLQTVNSGVVSSPPPAPAPSPSVVRLTPIFGVTESGNSSNWTYTGAGGDFQQRSNSTVNFQAGVDGVIEFTHVNATADAVIGIDPVQVQANYVFDCNYGFWRDNSGALQTTENGTFTLVAASGSVVSGDKIRFARTGSTLVGSLFHGGTWTVLKTWTGVPTGVLFIGFDLSGVASITSILGTGLA